MGAVLRFARPVVVVVALAIVFCLAIPMSGAMDVALICCFVLGVALSVLRLERPSRIRLEPTVVSGSLAAGPSPRFAGRPPNLVALGSLLI